MRTWRRGTEVLLLCLLASAACGGGKSSLPSYEEVAGKRNVQDLCWLLPRSEVQKAIAAPVASARGNDASTVGCRYRVAFPDGRVGWASLGRFSDGSEMQRECSSVHASFVSDEARKQIFAGLTLNGATACYVSLGTATNPGLPSLLAQENQLTLNVDLPLVALDQRAPGVGSSADVYPTTEDARLAAAIAMMNSALRRACAANNSLCKF